MEWEGKREEEEIKKGYSSYSGGGTGRWRWGWNGGEGGGAVVRDRNGWRGVGGCDGL